mmetsp:Transcript_247/g.956  ORF Transcript_247/g.956 Transcript_247/m.956 type:complete len:300 (-) Transcript_247:412-1311(-)
MMMLAGRLLAASMARNARRRMAARSWGCAVAGSRRTGMWTRSSPVTVSTTAARGASTSERTRMIQSSSSSSPPSTARRSSAARLVGTCEPRFCGSRRARARSSSAIARSCAARASARSNAAAEGAGRGLRWCAVARTGRRRRTSGTNCRKTSSSSSFLGGRPASTRNQLSAHESQISSAARPAGLLTENDEALTAPTPARRKTPAASRCARAEIVASSVTREGRRGPAHEHVSCRGEAAVAHTALTTARARTSSSSSSPLTSYGAEPSQTWRFDSAPSSARATVTKTVHDEAAVVPRCS